MTPKNYIQVNYKMTTPFQQARFNGANIVYRWWLIFDLHGKPCRVGPGGTCYFHKGAAPPLEEAIRKLVSKYLVVTINGDYTAYYETMIAKRIAKLCPLASKEILELPIVMQRIK